MFEWADPTISHRVTLVDGQPSSLGSQRAHACLATSTISGAMGSVNQTCGFGGVAGDVPLIGDFNHDGIDDLVIYRNGTWYVHLMPTCTSGSADLTFGFGGVAGDVPLVADWDRDGIADLIIFRGGVWYVSTRRDGYAQAYGYSFGAPGDAPLAARFNQ